MSEFYADVYIKEFGVETQTDGKNWVWVRFSPQPMSSIARKDSYGTITYDIVFQTESPQAAKPEKAFICHQDTYFCFKGEAVAKILTGPALLLCKQHRLKFKIYVQEMLGTTENNKGQNTDQPNEEEPLQTTQCMVNGKDEKCINVTEVVFQ